MPKNGKAASATDELSPGLFKRFHAWLLSIAPGETEGKKKRWAMKLWENVNVVGDAHRLPLPDGCLDGVHCEAVFEHLEDPNLAASELFRTMKPGAIAYVCTPFIQPFHGYPSHFQNFTHLGHKRLFERAGFRVDECGVCVGPAWAVATIISAFVFQYTPRLLHWPARAAWYVIGNLFVRPLDRWLTPRADAYVVASTTYVLLAKPR